MPRRKKFYRWCADCGVGVDFYSQKCRSCWKTWLSSEEGKTFWASVVAKTPHKATRGSFLKGQVGWNKGMKGVYTTRKRGTGKKMMLGKRVYVRVVEEVLGREISYPEVIHHINEDRSDNRLENLQFFRHQGAHLRIHHFARRHNIPLELLRIPWEAIYGKQASV